MNGFISPPEKSIKSISNDIINIKSIVIFLIYCMNISKITNF